MQYHARKILFLSAVSAGIHLLVGIAASLGSYDLTLKEVLHHDPCRNISFAWNSGDRGSDDRMGDSASPDRHGNHIRRQSRRCRSHSPGSAEKIPLPNRSRLVSLLQRPWVHRWLSSGGVKLFGSYSVVLNAFISAFLATLVIYTIAKSKGMTPESIILAGIAIMFLLDAVTSFTQYLGTAEQVQAVVFWMMGSVSVASWETVCIVFIIALISIPYLIYKASDLTIMGAGDETAHSLGINVEGVRMRTLIFAALLTASVTAFCVDYRICRSGLPPCYQDDDRRR